MPKKKQPNFGKSKQQPAQSTASSSAKIGCFDGPGTVLANQLMLVSRGFIRSLTDVTVCGEEKKRRGFVKGGSALLEATHCVRPLLLKKAASYGYAQGYDVGCGRQEHQKPCLWTCDRIAGREHYIVNMSVVLNTMLEGTGFDGMNRLTAGLGIGVLTKGPQHYMRDKVYFVLNEMAEESRRGEAKFAVEHFGQNLRNVFDGSWSKRLGTNSTTFVVQCIATETNKVIGTSVVSKICNQWKHHTKNDALLSSNREHECAKNWDGPTEGMEQYGVDCIVKKLLMENDIRTSDFVQMDGNTARSLCSLTWKNHTNDAMSKPDAVNFIVNLATCIWNNGHQSTMMDLFARLSLDLPAERLTIAIEDDIERFLPGQRRAVKRRDEGKKALESSLAKEAAIEEANFIPPPLRVYNRKVRPRGSQQNETNGSYDADVVAIDDDGNEACISGQADVVRGLSGRIRNLPKISYASLAIPSVKRPVKEKKIRRATKTLAARIEESALQAELDREVKELSGSIAREKRARERTVRDSSISPKKRHRKVSVDGRTNGSASPRFGTDDSELPVSDSSNIPVMADNAEKEMSDMSDSDGEKNGRVAVSAEHAVSTHLPGINAGTITESVTVFASSSGGQRLSLKAEMTATPRGMGRPEKFFNVPVQNIGFSDQPCEQEKPSDEVEIQEVLQGTSLPVVMSVSPDIGHSVEGTNGSSDKSFSGAGAHPMNDPAKKDEMDVIL